MTALDAVRQDECRAGQVQVHHLARVGAQQRLDDLIRRTAEDLAVFSRPDFFSRIAARAE